MTKVTCDKCGKESAKMYKLRIRGDYTFQGRIVDVDLDLCLSCIDLLHLRVVPTVEEGTAVERLAELLALVVQDEVAEQTNEG